MRPFVQVEKGSAPSELPTASTIIAKLKERSSFWRDYQCKFRLRVDSKTSKFSSHAILSVEGRKFVRFETFTPFGQTAALYISNEAGPSLLIPSERVIFTAHRPETLIRRFLGVSLSADLFRCLLAASIPAAWLDHVESHCDAGIWSIVSRNGGGWFEWQIAARPLALEGLAARSAEFDGRVSYDPPVPLTMVAVPSGIRISSTEWKIRIVVEKMRPATHFQPSTFYMPNLSEVRKADLDRMK